MGSNVRTGSIPVSSTFFIPVFEIIIPKLNNDMKRVYLLFLTFFLFLAGSVSCDNQEQKIEIEPSSIELGFDGNLQVSSDGGVFVITYNIVNPVESAKIVAQPAEDWLYDFNCDTFGKIAFSVGQNEDEQSRSAVVPVNYVSEEGDVLAEAEFAVVQDAAVPVEYDYILEAEYFDGLYYAQQFSINYNYYAWISSKPFDDAEFFIPGGIYYVFDIYTATPPEDESNPAPPAGVYTLGEYGSTEDMTFSMESRRCYSVDFETTIYNYFVDGTLTITKNGDEWTYEASLEDTDGKMHYLTYSGNAPYVGDKPVDTGLKRIEHDINTVAVSATGSYMRGDDEVMEVSLQMQDMEMGVWHGTRIYLDVFMPYDVDGNIENGTYTLTRDNGEPGTIVEGILNEEMQYPYPTGSYAQYYDENSDDFLGLFDSGTLEVTGDAANGYELVLDFVTMEGYSVKCSYSGPLTIIGIPGPYSTLTDDHTLDLTGAEADAYFYGDYFLTGGNWIVEIIGEEEGLTMDIVADTLHLDFAEGIPSGVYKACEKSYLGPWEYQPGSMSYGGSLSGTNYLGGFEGDGNVSQYAPATSGDLIITNHGDGSYTVSFEFLDDKGHTWDGEWTGVINLIDDRAMGAPPVGAPRSRFNVPLRK